MNQAAEWRTGGKYALSRYYGSCTLVHAQHMTFTCCFHRPPGISVNQYDMAPVNNFGQNFATYVFCILLWLGSSFVVRAWLVEDAHVYQGVCIYVSNR